MWKRYVKSVLAIIIDWCRGEAEVNFNDMAWIEGSGSFFTENFEITWGIKNRCCSSVKINLKSKIESPRKTLLVVLLSLKQDSTMATTAWHLQ